jgi:protein-disulfide isomerase
MPGSTAFTLRRRRIILALAILIAALAAAALALAGGGSGDDGRSTADAPIAEVSEPDQSPQGPDLSRREASDAMAIGRVDAPVVMIEYSDFQCPFCGRFARETEPALVKKYVDAGVLRIEWRNFPIFGEESARAARAGYAAGQQGKFWQYHDIAYAESRRRNSGAFSKDRLVAMAREAGVPDLERFRTDLDSDAARQSVDRDLEEGYKLGVTSTPAFLINGEPVLGGQPTATFESMIDKARERVGW